MPGHYSKPSNPDMQSFTTGPRTPGMGPVSDREMKDMMNMMPSRQKQLQDRGYQRYMEALGRLRQQEAQGLAPSAAPAADAQNRMNEIRSNMTPASPAPGMNLEDYFNQSFRQPTFGSTIGETIGSMPGETSDIEMAVQSGQMSPADAATAATGLPNPFNQDPRPEGALGGLGAASDQEVQNAMPLAQFLKNMQMKGR